VTKTRHGTSAGWHTGCRCNECRRAHSDTQRAFGRARAQTRLPIEQRQQLLDAIGAGQPFRTAPRGLGLTPNQVWGLARTDEERSAALETALTASRRVDFQHGTNAAYVHGCVCSECRDHQQSRMGGTAEARRVRGLHGLHGAGREPAVVTRKDSTESEPPATEYQLAGRNDHIGGRFHL
jgi:hypothetical protein